MSLGYELVDRGGHIAVKSEPYVNWSKPEMTVTYWIFPDRSEYFGELSHWRQGRGVGNNYVEFYNTMSMRHTRFLCDATAKVENEVIPVPKPGRGGKKWYWKWVDGKWRKEY